MAYKRQNHARNNGVRLVDPQHQPQYAFWHAVTMGLTTVVVVLLAAQTEHQPPSANSRNRSMHPWGRQLQGNNSSRTELLGKLDGNNSSLQFAELESNTTLLLEDAAFAEPLLLNTTIPKETEELPVVVVEGLSVDVTFEDILKTVIFLMASWMMAALSQGIGLPSLVGEIMTGFLLGPPWLDFVAYPEAMVLIGSFGLIGLLLDSGINLDVAQLRETGSRAVLMAVVGTILALAVGLGMGHAANSDNFKSSFAIGAAFAPSSFGVASQVLSKGEILNTPMGQVIVAASVVDDILGLILLSLMEVLVKETPTVLDYVLPFLSSFGYLLVLGFFGIMIVPKLVETKILPFFKQENRDFVAFSMLFIVLACYLPLLYYSGASYLTGAFLAGLSFSQIPSVHAQYCASGPHLKIWLMRIFFAATIGFQVPIKYFTDGDVLNWGFLYFIPVLAKLPLGALVPRMSTDLPDDFPYDPYWRDVYITTLAMLCRGEFNFIVASFALSAGVLEPEQYAAVVFAILLSAVIAPLVLSRVIIYYNNKFKDFLSADHKVNRIDGTLDGSRPLFLAIQARTPVTWSLQEKFKIALENAGLIVIDHRSWHTQGLEAENITEIFCQDKIGSVRIRQAFDSKQQSLSLRTTGTTNLEDDIRSLGRTTIGTIPESPSRECLAAMEEEQEEEESEEQAEIELRKQIVRDALIECLGPDVDESSYSILVSQWETFVFEGATPGGGNSPDDTNRPETQPPKQTGYRFVTPAPSMAESTQNDDIAAVDSLERDLDDLEHAFGPLTRLRSMSMESESLAAAVDQEPDRVDDAFFLVPLAAPEPSVAATTTGSPRTTGRTRGHRRNVSQDSFFLGAGMLKGHIRS